MSFLERHSRRNQVFEWQDDEEHLFTSLEFRKIFQPELLSRKSCFMVNLANLWALYLYTVSELAISGCMADDGRIARLAV